MESPVFLPEKSDFMTSCRSTLWTAGTNFLDACFKFSKKMGKLLQKHQNFKFSAQKNSSLSPPTSAYGTFGKVSPLFDDVSGVFCLGLLVRDDGHLSR